VTYERLAEVRALAELARDRPWAVSPAPLAKMTLELCDVVEGRRGVSVGSLTAITDRIAAFVTAAVASATDSARLALELQLCQEQRDAASRSAAADDPTLDATDGAHPAWWRGHDHGVEQAVSRLLHVVVSGCDEQVFAISNEYLRNALLLVGRSLKERDEAIAQRDVLEAELARFAALLERNDPSDG
jgi:hypothetical protein